MDISKLDLDRIIQSLKISNDLLVDTDIRKQYSDEIAKYFNRYFLETHNSRFEKISNKVADCNDFWFFDFFKANRIYDLQHVNLCSNKFCPNCQKMLQATRLRRYGTLIAEIAPRAYLCHLVLTIPNMKGDCLKDSVNCLLESFSKLNNYLRQVRKIKGINLDWGYLACNCVLALDKTFVDSNTEFFLIKKHINKYSYDKNILRNKFSDAEILIQKLWRCIYDNNYERMQKTS